MISEKSTEPIKSAIFPTCYQRLRADALSRLAHPTDPSQRTGQVRKVNTSKQMTHSLYRQGLYWYGRIATIRESSVWPLLESYDSIVREHMRYSPKSLE